jgi:hypothetical protein
MEMIFLNMMGLVPLAGSTGALTAARFTAGTGPAHPMRLTRKKAIDAQMIFLFMLPSLRQNGISIPKRGRKSKKSKKCPQISVY